ncbi:hypothetical protein ASD47_25085 [Caulobacter sp. Root1472]|nr:hypothetical protein ASD47_25085 [Caulobacter sp. Root1472]
MVAFSDGTSTWTYGYSYVVDTTTNLPDDGILTTTVTDPQGNVRVVKSRVSNSHVISDKFTGTNGLTQTTTLQYSADDQGLGKGKINQITYPEGNREYYEFDDYRNVTAAWRIPKGVQTGVDPEVTAIPGATVARASYSCRLTFAGGQNCKSPDWTRDARGNQTDYAYDPATGELLSVTQPAGPNGVRPQTRYNYASFTARYVKNGVMTVSPPVRRLVRSSTCASGAAPACLGTADETVIDYGYEDSNTPNNVLLASKTVRSGDMPGPQWATTHYYPNDRGDVVLVDGPLPGSDDLTQIRYDASRWKIGEVGPDPDGAGQRKHPATKTVYRADGQVQETRTGVVADFTDDAFDNHFQVLQHVSTGYDAQARTTLQTSYGSDNHAFAQTQTAYDVLGRLSCATQRMNPAKFDAPPASACSLGVAGGDGPDRITVTEYDPAGRVADIVSGYLTSAQRIEKVVTYTPNGREATVADGKGNVTTYAYDSLDRLASVRYPNASGGGSSASDYDAYGYDEADNRVTWRLRDGQVRTFSYDALNRAQNGLRGEVYTYDNLGRRTSAAYAGGIAQTAYDAFGRVKSETTNGLTMSYEYDLAGNRTKLTWPDNIYATYDYDLLGAMTGVHESGGLFAVSFYYNDLGQLYLTYRANGVPTWRDYDTASRLVYVSQDAAGVANDQVWTFDYTAAAQLRTRNATNAAYEWSGGQVGTSYVVNGLNQLTQAASSAITSDPRGNLAGDGARAYCYDVLNNLTAADLPGTNCAGLSSTPGSAGARLAYEPSGRLWKLTAGATTTTFLYSGSDLVAEYDGSTLLRRYLPSPSADAPLIWYEGSGTSDRRWLLADVQGSIIGAVNDAGASIFTNTYDEYGVPAAGNQGRFQYTGQAWIPEIGLYHYKARAYSPTLGRFLQTDPTGYDDGLNWYAYVGNDPVNRGDPAGTTCAPLQSCPGGQSKIPQAGTMSRVPASEARGAGADRAAQVLSTVADVQTVKVGIIAGGMAKAGSATSGISGASKSLGVVGTALTVASEGLKVKSEIQNGQDPGVAIAGAGGRMGTTSAASALGGFVGGLLGAPGGPPGVAAGIVIGGGAAGIGADKLGATDAGGRAAQTAYGRAVEATHANPDWQVPAPW